MHCRASSREHRCGVCLRSLTQNFHSIDNPTPIYRGKWLLSNVFSLWIGRIGRDSDEKFGRSRGMDVSVVVHISPALRHDLRSRFLMTAGGSLCFLKAEHTPGSVKKERIRFISATQTGENAIGNLQSICSEAAAFLSFRQSSSLSSRSFSRIPDGSRGQA